MKKKLLNFLKVFIALYLILCVILYFNQEKLIFFPEQLEKNYEFKFGQNFEELNFKTTDNTSLNGLLFKADNSKGLIFYLHGNAGSLSSWGNVAQTYTELDYDVFILDYRSYGKSEGTISGQEQLFEDNQFVYNELKKEYNEQEITILGYSIGTGLASKLASDNSPKQLILQAPYYSLTNMMNKRFWFIPTFILKYKFATNDYLKDCKMPITIFHGKVDQVISFKNSLKLKAEFENKINLIELAGQGHNGITDNNHYKMELQRILKE